MVPCNKLFCRFGHRFGRRFRRWFGLSSLGFEPAVAVYGQFIGVFDLYLQFVFKYTHLSRICRYGYRDIKNYTIGPFFLVGAIFSGTAAVVIVLAILRKVYHLEEALPVALFNSLRKLLITFTLGWLYFMIAEYLTIFYGSIPEEMEVFWQKFTGDFSIMFWTMTIFVFIIPLYIFVFRGKNNIPGMVIASILVNIGMWLERYIVIIPTETRPRLLYELVQGAYTPTWTEWVITLSMFAGLGLLYAVFTRFFPIVPLWETAGSLEPDPDQQRKRRPRRAKERVTRL